jgi:hypothetical protein
MRLNNFGPQRSFLNNVKLSHFFFCLFVYMAYSKPSLPFLSSSSVLFFYEKIIIPLGSCLTSLPTSSMNLLDAWSIVDRLQRIIY